MVPGRLPPPRSARSTRHPPMRQCSSLATGESRALHKTFSGEWCCLMVSCGSRDHRTIFQYPSASIWLSKAIRLACPRIWSSGTQAPLNPVILSRPIDPRLASRQRHSPPAPSASRSGRWLSHLPNQEIFFGKQERMKPRYRSPASDAGSADSGRFMLPPAGAAECGDR